LLESLPLLSLRYWCCVDVEMAKEWVETTTIMMIAVRCLLRA
jgi:hypothetical protein